MVKFISALTDVFKIAPVWYFIAHQDIVARYRRTTFGPLWITLSTGISLIAMSVVWGMLFQMKVDRLMPYMAPGMVIWTFISSILMEGSTVLSNAQGTLKIIKISPLAFILSFILKTLYIFAQNSIIIAIVFLIFRVPVSSIALLSVVGLALLTSASFFVTIILSIIGTRFRDFQQVIGASITFIMLLTPIMWDVSILKGKAIYIAYLNPVTYFLVLVRDPLLNKVPEMIYYYGAFSITAILAVVAGSIYSKYENRIIYWI